MKNFCVSILSPLLFFFSFLLASCGGEDPNDPGNRLSGILSGDVELVDEYGLKLADYGGVSVSVEGTSYTTTTNSEGYWRFDELPAGTYILKFTREGFAENRLYNQQFVGGGHLYTGTDQMYRLPSFSITSLNAYLSDTAHQHYPQQTGDTILTDTGKVVINRRDTVITRVVPDQKKVVISGEIDQTVPADRAVRVCVVLGSNAAVSGDPGNYRTILTATVPKQSNRFMMDVRVSDLERFAFASGSPLFLVAYPSASALKYIYDDQEKRTPIPAFLAPRPSAVVEVGL